MTINEIRELLVEECDGLDESIDRLHDVSNGELFSVEEHVALETIIEMLEICSEEQVKARRAAIIAARAAEVPTWPKEIFGPGGR